jgi:hypothetical protein
MNTFLYIVLGIVLVVIILALIAPKSYDVSRNININRTANDIFEYLRFLNNHDHWSPWFERDPKMRKTLTGTDGEVGYVSAWESDHKQVGCGEQEIKSFVSGKVINSELRFLKPFKSTSDAYLKFDEINPGETIVTWGFSGKNKFPVSIMMLFMNMDKAVGKDFEAGLAKLKTILEK